MSRIDIKKLLVSLAIPQLAGFLGALFTTPAIPAWYAGLNKPWFVPPNWLFAPAWTTLFLLMGLAFYLVWDRGVDFKAARNVFGIQLGLNILWSVMFFGLRSPLLGFLEIMVLWAAIALNILVFYRIDRRAGYLLVPYIAWVTFAAALNLWVFLLN